MSLNGMRFRFLEKVSDMSLCNVDRKTCRKRVTSLTFHPSLNAMLLAAGSQEGCLSKCTLSLFFGIFAVHCFVGQTVALNKSYFCRSLEL